MLDNFSNKISPVPRYSRRRFESSSTTRVGEDHRTLIGSQSRWGHRGDVRDALDASFWTVLGTRMDLFRPQISRYSAGTTNQCRVSNRPYRWMPIGAAQRELSRSNGERFSAPGYGCVPRAEWFSSYSTNVLSNVAHVSFDVDDGLRGLGKISASTTTDRVYWVRLLDYAWSIKLPLTPAPYTTLTGAVRSLCCLQVHLANVFAQGLQRTVDQSRGAAVYI